MGRYKNNPRRDYQTARILNAIRYEALTTRQIAERLHLSTDTITKYYITPWLESTPKRVFIEDYDRNVKGRPAPKYRAGSKADAEYIASRAPTRHKIIPQRMKTILQMVKSSPKTISQLSLELDLAESYVRGLVAKMRKPGERKMFIAAWPEHRFGVAPAYMAGDKPDVCKPIIDGKARYARFRERIQNDPDALERYQRTLERRRLNSRIQRLKSSPNSWASALGL